MKSAPILSIGWPMLSGFLFAAIGKRQSKQEQPKQTAWQEPGQQPKIEKEPEYS
jgi:hypothetical protein